jgi:hypothetical protein
VFVGERLRNDVDYYHAIQRRARDDVGYARETRLRCLLEMHDRQRHACATAGWTAARWTFARWTAAWSTWWTFPGPWRGPGDLGEGVCGVCLAGSATAGLAGAPYP